MDRIYSLVRTLMKKEHDRTYKQRRRDRDKDDWCFVNAAQTEKSLMKEHEKRKDILAFVSDKILLKLARIGRGLYYGRVTLSRQLLIELMPHRDERCALVHMRNDGSQYKFRYNKHTDLEVPSRFLIREEPDRFMVFADMTTSMAELEGLKTRVKHSLDEMPLIDRQLISALNDVKKMYSYNIHVYLPVKPPCKG